MHIDLTKAAAFAKRVMRDVIHGLERMVDPFEIINAEFKIKTETDSFLELKEYLYPRILYGVPVSLIGLGLLNLLFITRKTYFNYIQIIIFILSAVIFLYGLDMIFIGRTIKIDKNRRLLLSFSRLNRIFLRKRTIHFDDIDYIYIESQYGGFGTKAELLKLKCRNTKDFVICSTGNDIYLNRLSNLLSDYLSCKIVNLTTV